MIVPDQIDPIIAWRVWRFGDLLGSINSSAPVIARVPQVGMCAALRDHHVPDEQCTCGIYALSSRESAARKAWEEISCAFTRLRATSIAVGQIYLWGKVVEHEDGYRAEFAYPKTVLTDKMEDAERLAKLYNIEVERSCKWEELFEPYMLNPFKEQFSRYFRMPLMFGGPPPLMFGGPPAPSPPPTPAEQKKRNLSLLPAAYQPKTNRILLEEKKMRVAKKQAERRAEHGSQFWKKHRSSTNNT